MRRGVHTSRVLKALGTPNGTSTKLSPPPDLSADEIIPNEFPDVHEEEE
jgi:acetolactate synthase-1/3 small subunit